jgi:predicted RND superfamily exporter protein
MWNIFKKIGNFILSHKIVSIILIIVIVAGSWYGIKSFNKNQDSVKYVVAPVEKGTLVVSVSGTGHRS